jgi:hypothetical protein
VGPNALQTARRKNKSLNKTEVSNICQTKLHELLCMYIYVCICICICICIFTCICICIYVYIDIYNRKSRILKKKYNCSKCQNRNLVMCLGTVSAYLCVQFVHKCRNGRMTPRSRTRTPLGISVYLCAFIYLFVQFVQKCRNGRMTPRSRTRTPLGICVYLCAFIDLCVQLDLKSVV